MRPYDCLWVGLKLIGVVAVLVGLLWLTGWAYAAVEYLFRALLSLFDRPGRGGYEMPRRELSFYAPALYHLVQSLTLLVLGGLLIKRTDDYVALLAPPSRPADAAASTQPPA